MEPVLFYGVPLGSSFGSIVALEWLGQPYRLCRINMPGDMQNKFYDRFNPARETPVMLLEDGTPLSESVAILHNLAARDLEKKLGFAQGTRDFDLLNQRLNFLNTDFYNAFAPLWYSYEHELDSDAKAALGAMGRNQVAKAHAVLETLLKDREWIMGGRRTIADAYLSGIARWAGFHKAVDTSAYPRIQRLVGKLEKDPAVIFAHAIEEEKDAKSAGGFKGHVTLQSLAARLAA